MEIIDVDQDVFMGDFILDFDAFIRHGGNIADGEEDSKRISGRCMRTNFQSFPELRGDSYAAVPHLVTLKDCFHAQA